MAKKKSAISSSGKSTKKPLKKVAGKCVSSVSENTVRDFLHLGQLRAEKCELKEARLAYATAVEQAKEMGNPRLIMEALAGLLRLATEALDETAMKAVEQEMDALMAAYPRQIPPMVWYCKSVIARAHNQHMLVQRYAHRFIRAVRASTGTQASLDEGLAKGWVTVTTALYYRGRPRRAEVIANLILKKYGASNLSGIVGIASLLLGQIAEGRKEFQSALRWYQKAHTAFLAEHNWYYHLYVLLNYARISRHNQNYTQAYWYLDMLDKATAGPEFGLMRREVALERSRLEQDAVDLLIDSRKGVIQTRETGQVSLRKQYVLLHILEALSQAHRRAGDDSERGLSKAEIIEFVWKETYRPEAHDNKLYYNINRLRKLIEPDVRKPQYLLNWKEGYRLAPGLKVQFVGNGNEMGEMYGD